VALDGENRAILTQPRRGKLLAMSTSAPFDAQAARALARRSHGAAEILAEMKQAIVVAAERGEFEASVSLPDAVQVPAGQSINSATFLVEHLQQRELPAWAEAVTQALRAAYGVRPAWAPMGVGAACDGVCLSWSLVVEEPEAGLRLMPARDAYRMAMGARAQHQWVERALDQVRRAAAAGRSVCTVADTAPFKARVWPLRRELLKEAGFTTDLVATERGTDLVIRW
jgi:hypothetical protein